MLVSPPKVARSPLGNTHIDAGCGRVELVFGQGRRGRRGQPGRGALIEEDAAVGEAVPPQVSVSVAHVTTGQKSVLI